MKRGSTEGPAIQTDNVSFVLRMHTDEQNQAVRNESPSSRFTAVNGKEKASPVVVLASGTPGTGSIGASRRGSDKWSNDQPRISFSEQEKLTITATTSQREDWIQPPCGNRHQYQPPSGYSEAEMSHKRTYHSHTIPSATKQTPTTEMTESNVPQDESLRAPLQSDQRNSYETGTQYRQSLANEEAPDAGAPHDHDDWHSDLYSAQTHTISDERIREALQRASQNMNAQQRGGYQSLEDDDSSANPYGNCGHDRREVTASSNPKKRKRNFSNRTKTGCMTCRKRKKKCDEDRPECKSHNTFEALQF